MPSCRTSSTRTFAVRTKLPSYNSPSASSAVSSTSENTRVFSVTKTNTPARYAASGSGVGRDSSVTCGVGSAVPSGVSVSVGSSVGSLGNSGSAVASGNSVGGSGSAVSSGSFGSSASAPVAWANPVSSAHIDVGKAAVSIISDSSKDKRRLILCFISSSCFFQVQLRLQAVQLCRHSFGHR